MVNPDPADPLVVRAVPPLDRLLSDCPLPESLGESSAIGVELGVGVVPDRRSGHTGCCIRVAVSNYELLRTGLAASLPESDEHKRFDPLARVKWTFDFSAVRARSAGAPSS